MTGARGAIWHPSPNFGERRGGAQVRLIVLHYTAMDSAEAALERLCDPAYEVSAHYLIGRDGRLWQLVAEDRRAWHAGAGAWGCTTDVNSASIGIELDNDGKTPFSAPMMARLETLLLALLSAHGLPLQAVIGHSDMAPGRKHDPGPRFDWRRLARQGLSVWPDASLVPAEADPDRFRRLCTRFGYPESDDVALLDSVRSRFRPWGRGPFCAADTAVLADLAARFPTAGD
jgi:N-acetylmuramoyl-L-alanine amidase